MNLEAGSVKRTLFTVIAIACILTAVFLIGTGFQKRVDIWLVDYSAAEDGTNICLHVSMAFPMGYTRGFKNNGGGAKPHYLTFYNTFGGLNSSFGAKNYFTLEVEPEDTEIYFNRSGGRYELVLQKDDDTGEWIRPAR